MITTKKEMIENIYGKDIPFIYDTALPQEYINDICSVVSKDWKVPFNEVYTIALNSVYAYSRSGHTNLNGFIPLTFDCFRIFVSYTHITGKFPLYVPTLRQ